MPDSFEAHDPSRRIHEKVVNAVGWPVHEPFTITRWFPTSALSFNSSAGPTANCERTPRSTDESSFCSRKILSGKILHTVQVERNGFVHAMDSGTPDEGKGCENFGKRAYGKWIQSE